MVRFPALPPLSHKILEPARVSGELKTRGEIVRISPVKFSNWHLETGNFPREALVFSPRVRLTLDAFHFSFSKLNDLSQGLPHMILHSPALLYLAGGDNTKSLSKISYEIRIITSF